MGKKKKMRWYTRAMLGAQFVLEAMLVAPEVMATYQELKKAEREGKPLPAEYVPMARKAMKPFNELAEEIIGQ